MTVSRLTGTVFHSIPYLSTSKEIEQFVSTPFYEIEGSFTAKNGMYKGKAKLKVKL